MASGMERVVRAACLLLALACSVLLHKNQSLRHELAFARGEGFPELKDVAKAVDSAEPVQEHRANTCVDRNPPF